MDEHHAVSVSLDQRLILWRLEATRLKWLSTICCDISDIQGLDVVADSSGFVICVYGQGIQILRVNSSALSEMYEIASA